MSIHEYERIDPRGPTRQIVAVVTHADGTAITCNCGHTYDRNQTFQYKVGAYIRCYECRDARDNIKPEYRDLDDGRSGAGFGLQSIAP